MGDLLLLIVIVELYIVVLLGVHHRRFTKLYTQLGRLQLFLVYNQTMLALFRCL